MSPAHLRDLAKPACATCARPATKGLYNTQNALINYYCSRHAERALREYEART